MSNLNDVNVGDLLLISKGNYRNELILPVVKVTKTQIVASSGNSEIRFSKSSGYEVGGRPMFRWWVSPITQERADEIQREQQLREHKRKLVYEIDNANLDKLSIGTLEQIYKLICKHNESQQPNQTS
ncbi:hypothetical protein [Scytonema sp. NUACC26]|uniref:beta barrel domain-containing protein n=1 Tax=Scytonema sp. NUACC26 TaxID=3140176 RepID=UPI0034DC84BA